MKKAQAAFLLSMLVSVGFGVAQAQNLEGNVDVDVDYDYDTELDGRLWGDAHVQNHTLNPADAKGQFSIDGLGINDRVALSVAEERLRRRVEQHAVGVHQHHARRRSRAHREFGARAAVSGRSAAGLGHGVRPGAGAVAGGNKGDGDHFLTASLATTPNTNKNDPRPLVCPRNT